MSGILWLASYPKSGNTWFRAFVANLKHGDKGPVDINDLPIPIASSRRIFDDAAGVESTELTAEEIARFRPRVYRRLAETSAETVFLKIHDAYTLLPDGEPLIPTDATAGAIYIVRNPLDVAISYAHHSSKPVDRIIANMGPRDVEFSDELPAGQLIQRLLTWSQHVLSWIDQQAFPVHVVRYEDMQERPLETFTAAVRFCGLPCDPGHVRRALDYSSFEELQKQELEFGFKERLERAPSFFRQGKAGAWREVLSPSQIARITHDHEAVMERFGYLPL
jgi:aryl sulfotransferase